MKSNLGILKLVYHPVSNQEAEWLKDDQEVRNYVKDSHLYMVCQRAEAQFEFNEKQLLLDTQNGFFEFSIQTKNAKSIGKIDIDVICKMHDLDQKDILLEFELGPKMFRFWRLDPATQQRISLIDWFTTEKIFWDKWRGHPAIKGLTNYRNFTEYKLHYIGISKKEDSLTRLVVRPHDKRVRILSNEYTEDEWARVTDEILLMFFRIDPIQVNIFDKYDDITALYKIEEIDQIKMIADAEKALIKILNSKYNTEKYVNYPQGVDGLFGSGLDKYGYILGEDITLMTQHNSMHGSFIDDNIFTGAADLIMIEGDSVEFIKFHR